MVSVFFADTVKSKVQQTSTMASIIFTSPCGDRETIMEASSTYSIPGTPYRTTNVVHRRRRSPKETRSQDIIVPIKRSPLIHYENMDLLGGVLYRGFCRVEKAKHLNYSILQYYEISRSAWGFCHKVPVQY